MVIYLVQMQILAVSVSLSLLDQLHEQVLRHYIVQIVPQLLILASHFVFLRLTVEKLMRLARVQPQESLLRSVVML